MSNTISRRSLARGAAWAAPVVLASATVPAYAASTNKCENESVVPGGETFYEYGKTTYNYYTGRANSDVVDSTGYINSLYATVQGLLEGELIVSAEFTLYVENLNSSLKASMDQGFYDPNTYAPTYYARAMGKGWSTTPELISVHDKTVATDQGNVTKKMWGMRFTNTSAPVLSYSNSQGRCGSASIRPVVTASEGFVWTQQDVPAVLRNSSYKEASAYTPNQVFEFVFTTNKGRTITSTNWFFDNVNGRNSANAGGRYNFS